LASASTPASHTLSLHDALPIYIAAAIGQALELETRASQRRIHQEPRQAALALNPALPFFDRHHDHAGSAIARDGLWLFLRFGNQDRKSTRLNSSHVKISYADCC